MLCSMHKPRTQALKLCDTQLLLLPLHIVFPSPALGDGKAKGQVDGEGASVAGLVNREFLSAKGGQWQPVSSVKRAMVS